MAFEVRSGSEVGSSVDRLLGGLKSAASFWGSVVFGLAESA
jgi:hypothetical protein